MGGGPKADPSIDSADGNARFVCQVVVSLSDEYKAAEGEDRAERIQNCADWDFP